MLQPVAPSALLPRKTGIPSSGITQRALASRAPNLQPEILRGPIAFRYGLLLTSITPGSNPPSLVCRNLAIILKPPQGDRYGFRCKTNKSNALINFLLNSYLGMRSLKNRILIYCLQTFKRPFFSCEVHFFFFYSFHERSCNLWRM